MENEFKHTPGPWAINEDPYDRWKFKGGWNGKIVAGNGASVYNGPSSFNSLRCDTEDEAKANARLIAAAPELLEALNSAVEFIDTYGSHRHLHDSPESCAHCILLQAARAAIAKATAI